MKILTQGKGGMHNYRGTVGAPTNMYDSLGHALYVGDIVGITTQGIDGRIAYDYSIAFVCEENTKIANWIGRDYQYIMGIADVFNSNIFSEVFGDDTKFECNKDDMKKFSNNMDKIEEGGQWKVFKVKSFEDLVIREKIGCVYVDEVMI